MCQRVAYPLDHWAIQFTLHKKSRYRDTQFQVTEHECDFKNLGPFTYQCFKIEGMFYCEQLVIRDYASVKITRNVAAIDIFTIFYFFK